MGRDSHLKWMNSLIKKISISALDLRPFVNAHHMCYKRSDIKCLDIHLLILGLLTIFFLLVQYWIMCSEDIALS